ncbi:MAG: family 16 glycoside hydrolase [Vicinamibacterales bacterium]
MFNATSRLVLGAMFASAIGAAPLARQGQTPAPPSPTPQTARPQTPAAPSAADSQAAGRRGGGAAGGQGQPNDSGPVRSPSGAVVGFTNLAEIPGTPWRIHDASRPQPRVVTPGATPSGPPSDAIVLFDGKDLSKWVQTSNGHTVPATWPIKDGYFETGARTGSLWTRDNFGDVQLHIEFATPESAQGDSQGRGNSGVKFMGFYEVEVLDSYQNMTYADGYAGAIYGEQPPLVNVARKPGEWQVFDIIFEAPKFNAATLVAPAYMTVFWNGVLVQHRRAVMGNTSATRTPHAYTAHDAELPLMLQDHSNPVKFRNVWIRKLKGYDQ